MGAIVALALAARLPDHFRAVGLVGLPIYSDRADGLAYLHRRGLAHRAFLHTDGIAHAGCLAMHRLRGAWLPFAPVLFPRQPREVLRTAFDHCRDSHFGSLNQIIFADLAEQLADGVRTPVVALHGARDGAAPIDRVRTLAAREGWTLKVSPTGTHQIAVERPALTARWIREWLIPAGATVGARLAGR